MMAKIRSLLIIIAVAAVLYATHAFILSHYYEGENPDFNLIAIYVFFTVCAAVIVLATRIVDAKNHDITGYVFVGLTLVQMGLSYLMLRPILTMGDSGRFEKTNFFIIFILFLSIETVLTIRLLNNKQ